MFDFSLTEMMLAGVVALVVLGPERLPVVARKAGQWMAKIQSLAAGVRSELAAHAEVAELIKVKQELEETSAEIQQDLQNLSKQVEQNSQEIAEHLHDSVPAARTENAGGFRLGRQHGCVQRPCARPILRHHAQPFHRHGTHAHFA